MSQCCCIYLFESPATFGSKYDGRPYFTDEYIETGSQETHAGATAGTAAGPSEPTSSLQSQAEVNSFRSAWRICPQSIQKYNTGFWRRLNGEFHDHSPQYMRTNANRALKLQPRIWVMVGLKPCEPPPLPASTCG